MTMILLPSQKVLIELAKSPVAKCRRDLMKTTSCSGQVLCDLTASGAVERIAGRSPDRRGVMQITAWYRLAGSSAPVPEGVELDVTRRPLQGIKRRVLEFLRDHGPQRSASIEREAQCFASTLCDMHHERLISRDRSNGNRMTLYSCSDFGRQALELGYYPRASDRSVSRGECEECGAKEELSRFRGRYVCGRCLLGPWHERPEPSPTPSPAGWEC